MPDSNFDLVLLIGPGVIIGIVVVLIYYFRSRREPK